MGRPLVTPVMLSPKLACLFNFFTKLLTKAEIGGGYLVWQWLQADRPAWTGAAGAVLLVLYSWIATWQPTSFGKTYAVYGGIFIVMSIAWAWYFDGFRPDHFDVLGGLICFAGIAIILFWPRP